MDSTVYGYDTVFGSLSKAHQEFISRLGIWSIILSLSEERETREKTTIRPVTEILMEAILLTLEIKASSTGGIRNPLAILGNYGKPQAAQQRF